MIIVAVSVAVVGGIALAAQGLAFSLTSGDTQDTFFIEKDTKRFPDTKGWAYAVFIYNPASDTFRPDGNGANCGFACHTIVASKDYIFHSYQKR
jgi:hypothetical protein